MVRLNIVLFCLLFGIFRGESAEDASAQFREANRLYESGAHTEAIRTYEAVAQRGFKSSSVYFNLGTAHLQANQNGKAIASFLQSIRLAPRDNETRNRLRLARTRAGASPLTRFSEIDRLTVREWQYVVLASCWLMAASALLRTSGKVQPGQLRWFKSFPAIALCVALAALLLRAFESRTPIAVVIEDVSLKRGPVEESPSIVGVRSGAEARVIEQHGEWMRLKLGSGEEGWTMRRVLILP